MLKKFKICAWKVMTSCEHGKLASGYMEQKRMQKHVQKPMQKLMQTFFLHQTVISLQNVLSKFDAK